MSKKDLIIIGTSGHGKVVAEIAELTGQYNNIYFMDDFSEKKTFHGYKNLGPAKRTVQHKDKADFFVAVGDNAVRKDKLDALIKEDYSIATNPSEYGHFKGCTYRPGSYFIGWRNCQCILKNSY